MTQSAKLAKKFGVCESAVLSLHGKGLGWSAVGHALKPLSDILSLRKSGMGWEKIARTYGVPPERDGAKKHFLGRSPPRKSRPRRVV
jgi:hypothetical protein